MAWGDGGFVWRWISERDLRGRFAGHGAGQAVLRGAVVGLGGRHGDGNVVRRIGISKGEGSNSLVAV